MKNYLSNGYVLFSCLLLASIGIFFHHAGQLGFFMDGYFYAAFGKHAALYNEWLVPSLNKVAHVRFHDHIPFFFWMEGAFFKIFGATYASARIFINLFSLVQVLVLFIYLRKIKLFGQSFIASFFILIALPFLKQSRFPNLDIPLTLFCFLALLFYFEFLRSKKNKHWYKVGLFFGLAMLTKGPMAIFIPITLFIHLLAIGRKKELLRLTPWLAFLFAFLVFAMWPILLFQTNNMDIFRGYFEHTFLGTMRDARGVSQNDYFLYVRHLLTFCFPQVALATFAVYRYFQSKRKDEFFLLNLIMFFVVLITTSMMKFKYSHYILPLFPSLSIIASYGLLELKKIEWSIYLAPFALLLAFVLFFFPVTEKRIRDAEIYAVIEKLEKRDLSHSEWINVNEAYPYWAVAGLLSFHNRETIYPATLDSFSQTTTEASTKQVVILVKDESKDRVIKSYPKAELLEYFSNLKLNAYLVVK